MRLINLTPHTVTIITKTKSVVVQPSEEFDPPRVITEKGERSEIELSNGVAIPVMEMCLTSHIDSDTPMPKPEKDTFYIVSRIVAGAAPDRDDLLIPGALVRDEKGNVTGCLGLSRLRK